MLTRSKGYPPHLTCKGVMDDHDLSLYLNGVSAYINHHALYKTLLELVLDNIALLLLFLGPYLHIHPTMRVGEPWYTKAANYAP